MTLPNGAHVELAGVPFRLDEAYEQITGRRCYIHGGRSIFADRVDIQGLSGKTLRSDKLVWYTTRFDGEGQVVLDNSDDRSADLFYRSEGLDLKTPGEARLNKSTLAKTVTSSPGGTTTYQGAADFADITGTSSTSGTDRRLSITGDVIGTTANFAPGATSSEAIFYLYRESLADYGTTIEGTSFVKSSGDVYYSGTDVLFRGGGEVRTTNITGLSSEQRVEFFLYSPDIAASDRGVDMTVLIGELAGGGDLRIVARKSVFVTDSSSPATANAVLTFDPAANRNYRFIVSSSPVGSVANELARKVVDKVIYGKEYSENRAKLTVYNQTGGAVYTTKTVTVNTTTAGKIAGSIVWSAAAATNYRFRVERVEGNQRIWVDKVEATALAANAWTLDCLDLGLQTTISSVNEARVWMAGHRSGANSVAWLYDRTNERWGTTAGAAGEAVTFNDGAATTTNATCLAMAHSDSLEYFLLNNNEVYTSTNAGVDDRYAYFSGASRTLVGMTVAQGRLILLAEDSSAIRIYSLPLDGAATPYDLTGAPTATIRIVDLDAGVKTASGALRQRMCSTPTGARFLVNWGDVTSKIYEVDGSGTTLTVRELADLGHGVQATCIAYEGGITFVGGRYFGDDTASDTDKKPRSALWAIDQNGVLQRIGFFRRDNPNVNRPQFLVPYQQDLYILQGPYVWRYSLVTGGLTLEYEMEPITASAHRALSVLFGRIISLYTEESFVTGSDGTYRTASVADGNTITTSITDMGYPTAIKALEKITVLTDEMDSDTQITLEYQIDQDGTWNTAGSVLNGTRETFYVDDTAFSTIQLRATLSSLTGTNTPVLRALAVEASASEQEEYFDLVLLCEDEDSSYRIANHHDQGSDKAASVIQAWRTGKPTTFIDAYNHGDSQDAYSVVIGDLRDERNSVGEGRVVMTLRVIR